MGLQGAQRRRRGENLPYSGARGNLTEKHESFKEPRAREEDIPLPVEKLGIGGGTRWGFRELSAEDVENIYRIAAHAEI